jgi:hypothetical protein
VPADWTVKQGDSAPILTDTLTYSNGQPVNLTGASLSLIVRAQTSAAPLKLTGTPEATAPLLGEVAYSPTTSDTASSGMFMANWFVVLPSGEEMTFPTDGYNWLSIEENLRATGGQQIVGLPEVKDALLLPANDRIHDNALNELIEDVAPLIEEHTGPLLLQTFTELFDGGNNIISLSHRPNYGYGTSPVLNILGVSEFRGPIEYPLAPVQNPVYGGIYTYELDPRLGTITRRTAGGGVIAFYPGRNSIRVTYQAGQERVPRNVRRAAIETIRWWYRTTMAEGKGAMTLADDEPRMPMVSLPYHAVAMLSPTRRHPSIA